MPTTHPRHLLATFALGLATLAGITQPAAARTAKPAGPALTIDAKTCSTGAEATQRYVVLTASAVLRDTGDEVQLRFTMQQRAAAKTSWRTVFAKTGDLGTWATSDPGADGLRYTKTINGLTEGTQYRVVVDARAVNDNGKVVTRTTRKTVTCLQPQLSARLVMVRANPILDRPAKGPVVRATIRNAGKQTSKPAIITVRDAATQAILGEQREPAITGRATTIIPVELTSCSTKIIVTVQEEGAPLTALAPDQSLTVDCTPEPPATPARLNQR